MAMDAPHLNEFSSARVSTGALEEALVRARGWLLARQHDDGYWLGELEGDSILQSEYILLLAFLGRERSDRARCCARQLIRQQSVGGGWTQYPGGDIDISASVKAYFALKLTGHDPHEEYMQRARAAILAAGGADRVNSFTRYYLALLGQIEYELCPAVPPELALLPTWSPINIYRMSAWSRTIFVPLSIVWAHRPVRNLDAARGIRELFLEPPHQWPPLACPGQSARRGRFTWEAFFRATDRWIKRAERWRLVPLRQRAIAAAHQWMLDRFQHSDGLGAIFPPIIWSVVALRCLGYADDSREMQYNLDQLEEWMLHDGDTTRLQPCLSPVWDTAIALRALAATGLSIADSRVRRGVAWLLDREITTHGDWSRTVAAKPSGWCFEFRNAYYPDVDDTAMVLMALSETAGAVSLHGDELLGESAVAQLRLRSRFAALEPDALPEAREQGELASCAAAAVQRGAAWMLAMQNRDGGWGAFDRDNDAEFLCRVPFADHNAMIDPSTPDLAARALEALGGLGRRVGDPAVDRCLRYLRRSQEADGSWYGRWGVNHIYGTWQVLSGLSAVGVPADEPLVVAGAHWLLAHQQPDGGWGESANSYKHSHLRGQGPPTASQTAWAVLGLIAADRRDHPATARGIRWLLDHQRNDGAWDEEQFTGTGFPLVFYLRYHLYRVYFPLLALARMRGHSNG